MSEKIEEIQSILLELSISKQALLKRNLVQQRLLTVISHDIKSPLIFLEMAARQFLKNLKSGTSDRVDSIKVAGLLQEGSYRLCLLIDNLLHYLKIYSREGAINIESVNLYELVNEKCRLFADIAASDGNQIVNCMPPDLYVKSDITSLNVILHNLLDNATKVTRDGQIKIGGELAGEYIHMRISDTGSGMAHHLIEWCNDIQRPFSGSGLTGGLGLVIVKELVDLIGGKLQVTSEPGNGTLINISLPVISISCQ